MSETMQADLGLVTAISGLSGGRLQLARRRTDVLAMTAARAHRDAEWGRSDAQVARRFSTEGRTISRRTASDWKRVGPPEVRAFLQYLMICGDPLRVAQDGVAVAKQRAVLRLPIPALIDRYHDLREHETAVEAEDRKLDVLRGVSWIDRATAGARNAAVDGELSAVEREFASLGMTEDDVFGRGR